MQSYPMQDEPERKSDAKNILTIQPNC